MTCYDPRPMRRCEDCGYWGGKRVATWRECKRLHLNEGRLWREDSDFHPLLLTPCSFACNESKEKPKGPFEVKPYGDHYILRHIETRYSFGDWDALIRAATVRDHLNELWAIAIGKRRE